MTASVILSKASLSISPLSSSAAATANAGQCEWVAKVMVSVNSASKHSKSRFQSGSGFGSTKIVSFCLFQKGMTGVEGRSPASRRRHFTTGPTLRKSRRQTLCRRAA
ncbi:hypothetical protein SAMN05216258_109242 [Albimonas pacifica]|uniref:Secreted protein n=1 Tax=Albimonas pacifica TaxID=1114924 RepID=A0A1I3L7S6_9RHOB|nr:hypothetical protein SAMN05216258_109242 [Albimonas pacifica]